MGKPAEGINQEPGWIARVLLLAGLLFIVAGYILLIFTTAAGILVTMAGLLLAGSGFVLKRKPEYIVLLGFLG